MSGQNFMIYECILTTPLLSETISNKLLKRIKKFVNILPNNSKNKGVRKKNVRESNVISTAPTKLIIPVILHHIWGFQI